MMSQYRFFVSLIYCLGSIMIDDVEMVDGKRIVLVCPFVYLTNHHFTPV
jgi:hypothetical protein